MLLYLLCVFSYHDPISKSLDDKDPEGKLTQNMIEAGIAPIIAAKNMMKDNKYTEPPIKDIGSTSLDIKKKFNAPIVPTVEERLFMSSNHPITIPYLVRPEQMLLLMMHD